MHPILGTLDKHADSELPEVAVRHLGVRKMLLLTTYSGRELVLSPETLFALKTSKGGVVISTRDAFFRGQPFTYNEQFDYGVIAGLLLATGRYTGRESTPASVRVPKTHSLMLDWVSRTLHTYQDQVKDARGHQWGIRYSGAGSCTVVQSRIIDLILTRELKGLISPVSLMLDVAHLRCATSSIAAGFIFGIIGGMAADGTPERAFSHRSSYVVREIARFLFEVGGIPVQVSVNPHERDTTIHNTRIKNPHRCVLPHAWWGLAGRFGMFDSFISATPVSELLYVDDVASLTPCEADAVEFVGNGEITCKGFTVDLDFEMPEAALDLAAMPELFTNVENPAALIARAGADRTHLFGVV